MDFSKQAKHKEVNFSEEKDSTKKIIYFVRIPLVDPSTSGNMSCYPL